MSRFKFLIPQLSDSKKRKVEIIKRGSKLQVMASFVVSYSTPSTPKKLLVNEMIFFSPISYKSARLVHVFKN